MSLPSGSTLLGIVGNERIYQYAYWQSGIFYTNIYSVNGSAVTEIQSFSGLNGVSVVNTLNGELIYEAQFYNTSGHYWYTNIYGTNGSTQGTHLLQTVTNTAGIGLAAVDNGFDFFGVEQYVGSGEGASVYATNGSTMTEVLNLGARTGVSYDATDFALKGAHIDFEVLETIVSNNHVSYETMVEQSSGTLSGTRLLATLNNTYGVSLAGYS